MKAIEMRLIALEKRTAHRGPAAVALLLSAADAGQVFDILRTLGDGVIEDVLRQQLGLPADAVLDDELLQRIAAGNN